MVAVSRLAGKIQLLLPGYAGHVQPAICHPFASLEPRFWYRADEHGAWVGAWLIGGDSLLGGLSTSVASTASAPVISNATTRLLHRTG